jgi:hypothetical protein
MKITLILVLALIVAPLRVRMEAFSDLIVFVNNFQSDLAVFSIW